MSERFLEYVSKSEAFTFESHSDHRDEALVKSELEVSELGKIDRSISSLDESMDQSHCLTNRWIDGSMDQSHCLTNRWIDGSISLLGKSMIDGSISLLDKSMDSWLHVIA
jgi:hypothetical protein